MEREASRRVAEIIDDLALRLYSIPVDLTQSNRATGREQILLEHGCRAVAPGDIGFL